MTTPFSLLVKPSGSDCNLDCTYCFYKNRFPELGRGRQRMSCEILDKMIRDYMELRLPVAAFAWQGGEPMLMGLDFYKRVVELQQKYSRPDQQVSNALQTNAVGMDDRWAGFLGANRFLVGISLDGPRKYHDFYRLDRAGKGTFDRVIRAIELCRQHRVEFNVLVLLNNINAGHADELYDFFVEKDLRFLQFIPCIEYDHVSDQPADFSITAGQYSDFLCGTFDRWIGQGPARPSIRDFDSILSYCLTGRHTICAFQRLCDNYIVVEHNGDCFPCDFFVDPKWRLGNILRTPIQELAAGSIKRNFARRKQDLGGRCILCRHLAVCRGGCVKNRIGSHETEKPQTRLCEAYKRFFDHSMPRFRQAAARIRAGDVDW